MVRKAVNIGASALRPRWQRSGLPSSCSVSDTRPTTPWSEGYRQRRKHEQAALETGNRLSSLQWSNALHRLPIIESITASQFPSSGCRNS